MNFSPTVSLRACYDKPRPYIDQSMLIPNGHGCLILEKHPYEVLFVSDFSAPCQGQAPLCRRDQYSARLMLSETLLQ